MCTCMLVWLQEAGDVDFTMGIVSRNEITVGVKLINFYTISASCEFAWTEARATSESHSGEVLA